MFIDMLLTEFYNRNNNLVYFYGRGKASQNILTLAQRSIC